MLIDSHCHLDRVDLKPYGNSFSRMMSETEAAGVAHMLCVSINLETFPAMRTQVAAYPQVSISVGIHPNEILEQEATVDTLVKLAQDQKVVAIGETGLDYFRTAENLFTQQQQRFRTHIQAAHICNKPLIIHSRQATQDTLQILREEQAANIGGVLHCFTEDWNTAKAALDMNFYISFSGIITFPNAAKLREVAKLIPLNRLLIETDSPYLAPVPQRGKSNEPKFVAYVAESIAAVRNISKESLVAATGENFMRLFRTTLNLKYFAWFMLGVFTLTNSQPSPAGWFATQEQEAAQIFANKHYEQAASHFSDPYRKGVAQYRAGDFSAAAISFEKVSRPEVTQDAHYNLGNARFQLGDLTGAIAAYETVLKENSHHEDAAYNLAIARSMLPANAELKEPEQPKPEPKQDQKQDQKQSESKQSEDSKQKQQEQEKKDKQSGDSKQEKQDKKDKQSGDSKQEKQKQSGDSKQEQQDKQQAGGQQESKQQQSGDGQQKEQESKAQGQKSGESSKTGEQQDQNQQTGQSGKESKSEQTGDKPSEQKQENQGEQTKSENKSQEQRQADKTKDNVEKQGNKGDKETPEQKSGEQQQKSQDQGSGQDQQQQESGAQSDKPKEQGEGGNKQQAESQGQDNADKSKQDTGGEQPSKSDAGNGEQEQQNKPGKSEQQPPQSKPGEGNQKQQNKSPASQQQQRSADNSIDLPADLPPESQNTAVSSNQLDQAGQAPDSSKTGDDGAAALGGNPAKGPGMAILEQMMDQVEGDPSYLMRNAFILEEAQYKRSHGGSVWESRPW